MRRKIKFKITRDRLVSVSVPFFYLVFFIFFIIIRVLVVFTRPPSVAWLPSRNRLGDLLYESDYVADSPPSPTLSLANDNAQVVLGLCVRYSTVGFQYFFCKSYDILRWFTHECRTNLFLGLRRDPAIIYGESERNWFLSVLLACVVQPFSVFHLQHLFRTPYVHGSTFDFQLGETAGVYF